MSETPRTCPTCSAPVAPGAVRCLQCGRIFGEENRCPYCNAVAAVRRSGGAYRCMACNHEREAPPGTVVQENGRLVRVDELTVKGVDPANLAQARAMRLTSALLMASAILALAVALTGQAAPTMVLIMIALVLGVGAFTTARRGRAVLQGARAQREKQLAQRVMQLAERAGGELRTDEVANELRIDPADADRTLTRLAEQMKASVEVDSEGRISYVFADLVASRGPRVRVPELASEQASIEAEARAKVERELARRKRG